MRLKSNTYEIYQSKFEIIKREGNVCLAKEIEVDHFEVFLVQVRGASKIADREVEAGEFIPEAGMWGQWGWTFRKIGPAESKFSALVQLQACKAEAGEEGLQH